MKPPGTATPNASARKRGAGDGDAIRAGNPGHTNDADATGPGGDDTPAKTSPPSPTAAPGFGGALHPFGQHLEPILRDACDGRLSAIRWFRTDWQRGGALTGYATFTDDAGTAHEAVVKLPVPPGERTWLLRLQGNGEETSPARGYAAPILHAHGDHLNGYDLAWVVMERLPHGPLDRKWHGQQFDLLVDAVGRFYEHAATFPVDQPRKHRDWEALLRKSRGVVRSHAMPDAQAWKKALKTASKKIDRWVHAWNARPMNDWCHGDLHLGNAMSRHPHPPPPEDAPQKNTSPKVASAKHAPQNNAVIGCTGTEGQDFRGAAVLLDLAEVRPGHWIEDAVYCEHLYWSRRHLLHGRKLCSMIAHQRRARGLSVGGDWAELAKIKRYLLALATPCWLDSDGDPRHVAAALAVLQNSGG